MSAARAQPGEGRALPGRVVLAFLVSTLIWGSTWTAIRYQLGTVDPSWSIAFRFVIACAALGAYARWSGVPLRLSRADLPVAAALGFTQFMLNFVFVYRAEAYITSGLVAMIFALLIIPNAVLGRLLLGHRVGRNFIVGSALAIGGMALLFHKEVADAAAGGGAAMTGIGLTLAGVVAASFGNMIQASPRAHALSWAGLLVWAMGFGALFNALLALATHGLPVFDPRPEYWLALLFLGLFGSALTFPIYMFVLRRIGPAKAAYSSVLIPIVAMIFSTLLEGYRWTPSAVAGSALALAGLFVALKTRRPAG